MTSRDVKFCHADILFVSVGETVQPLKRSQKTDTWMGPILYPWPLTWEGTTQGKLLISQLIICVLGLFNLRSWPGVEWNFFLLLAKKRIDFQIALYFNFSPPPSPIFCIHSPPLVQVPEWNSSLGQPCTMYQLCLVVSLLRGKLPDPRTWDWG